MKVMAVNSSARTRGQSKTELMLDHLVRGMEKAGAHVDVIHLREKKIKECMGCFHCMTKTPGKCVLKDDMTREVFPGWLEADLIVYATPLFHHTVNAAMKRFIERTFPICEPFLKKQGQFWAHPLRSQFPAAVVLSVCGFPEMSAFGALRHYVDFLFNREEKGRLWAEIYRPGSEFLLETVTEQKDVLDATVQAGVELIETQGVSQQTLARIEQPLLDDFSSFADISNCMWQTCIDQGITRKEFTTARMIPRADSIETYLRIMALGFNPDNAGDAEVTIQNEFTGRVEGACHFIISGGTVTARQGKSQAPDLIITSPFDVWMDIVTGKKDGTQMIMEGKYQVAGKTDLIFDVPRFFERKK